MNTKKVFIIFVHAFIGWALCTASMLIGMATMSIDNALIVHAIGAPIIFTLVSLVYFNQIQLHLTVVDCAGFCFLCDRGGFLPDCPGDQPQPGDVHQPAGYLDTVCIDIHFDLCHRLTGYKSTPTTSCFFSGVRCKQLSQIVHFEIASSFCWMRFLIPVGEVT